MRNESLKSYHVREGVAMDSRIACCLLSRKQSGARIGDMVVAGLW